MYDFKKDEGSEVSVSEIGTSVMSLLVRLFGFFLLLAGLWIAITVMLEALELYENPRKIEQLAVHIERGSNIDSSLADVRIDDSQETLEADGQNSQNTNANVRVSYFFAWMIAILLLLLVGRISLTAIKTGGELVLYDVQIKRFARELARQSAKGPE